MHKKTIFKHFEMVFILAAFALQSGCQTYKKVSSFDFETASPEIRPHFTPTRPEKITAQAKAAPPAKIKKPKKKEKALETYTVEKGDSLWKISKKTKTSVNTLAQTNEISQKTLLKPGMLLVVPSQKNHCEDFEKKPNENFESKNWENYKVQAGDTLLNLALKSKTNLQKIKNINNLNTDKILIGQNLLLPKIEKQNTLQQTKQIESPEENLSNLYTVKSGDTLSVIAKKLNIPTSEIVALNGLENDTRIYVGQKLKLSNATNSHPHENQIHQNEQSENLDEDDFSDSELFANDEETPVVPIEYTNNQ